MLVSAHKYSRLVIEPLLCHESRKNTRPLEQKARAVIGAVCNCTMLVCFSYWERYG